jgi:hypothetical protein
MYGCGELTVHIYGKATAGSGRRRKRTQARYRYRIENGYAPSAELRGDRFALID